MEALLVAEYERAFRTLACATSPSGCATHVCTDLYTVQSTIARRGERRGRRRVVVVAKGALRRALRMRTMQSVAEVRLAFGRFRRSHN